MSTPEDRLIRSLPALRALIDSLAAHPSSEAHELLQLDHLVRKYPAAARESLRLRQRRRPVPWIADEPELPEWASVSDIGGVPLRRWREGPVYVATRDLDQLRFIAVALRHFDRMTAEELRAYLQG